MAASNDSNRRPRRLAGWFLLLPVCVLAATGILFLLSQRELAEQEAREGAERAMERIRAAISHSLARWRQSSTWRHPELTKAMLESAEGPLFEGDRPVPPGSVSPAASRCERLLEEGKLDEAKRSIETESSTLKLSTGIPAISLVLFLEARETGKSDGWARWHREHWPHALVEPMLASLSVSGETREKIEYLRNLQRSIPGGLDRWIDISESDEPESSLHLVPLDRLRDEVEDVLSEGVDRSRFRVQVNWRGRNVVGRAPENTTDSAAPLARLIGEEGALEILAWLATPEAVFHSYRRQTFWVASLIGMASLTAILGIFVLNRSLDRQWEYHRRQVDFVASVSHEFRTPVASMLLVSDRLMEGKVTEVNKQEEYFRLLQRECRRLGGLVESLLDHARLESGRKHFHFEPTDLGALVRDTVESLRTLAAERDLTLSVAMKEETGRRTMAIDGQELGRAISNLIENAIKYARDEGGTREIEVGMADSPEGDPEIIVRDENEVIPRAEREKIFQRFYRRGCELRRTRAGSGLGLSLVRHVAGAHGGTAFVRRRRDGITGNEFVIRLGARRTGEAS